MKTFVAAAALSLLGCSASNCATRCENKTADETCGSYYADILDCGITFGAVECSGADLVSTSVLCDSEVERYTQCLDMAAAAP